MQPAGPTNFFDAGSPYLSHPLLTAERSAAEVARICSEIGSTDRVLDLGCGFGRHALAFAARGSQVVGIDPSATMIEAANVAATDAGVAIDFRQADAADFVTDEPFDLVVLLFTTLGQLSRVQADSNHAQVLDRAFGAVRPDGHIVIEVPDRDRAVAALVESEELGPTTVTRSFDADHSVIHEHFDSPAGQFHLAYRVFDRAELVAEVERAGFVIEEVIEQALVPPPPTFMTLFAHRP